MKKILKKNQIMIYIIALMLMTAGYLNYTTNQENSLETSIQMEAKDDTKLADIGDARLVNGEAVSEQNSTNISDMQNSITENSTDTENIEKSEEKNNTNDAQKNDNNDNNIENNNSSIKENKTIETSANSNSDYFTKSKLERDTMYSQMLETYEKVLNSSNSLETQKQSATQEITKINNTKNSIMICENLIKTKGFENNIIFVNGESISIIIGTSEIKQEEVAQIQNIISREMKAEIENIHISTK